MLSIFGCILYHRIDDLVRLVNLSIVGFAKLDQLLIDSTLEII